MGSRRTTRPSSGSTHSQPELFQLFEEEPGDSRPPCLGEPREPQDQDQQRTVVQIVDNPLVVPSLDVPGPQGENQLVEAFRHLDLPLPEQVIEVPKISSSSRRSRRVLRAPQTAEQLVEVLTIVSFLSLHGLVEQNVDIPVPQGRGGRAGLGILQGLSQGQNSSAFRAEHVENPVPQGRGGNGGLLGLRPDSKFSCFIRALWCCG